jgi:hypothetical protein
LAAPLCESELWSCQKKRHGWIGAAHKKQSNNHFHDATICCWFYHSILCTHHCSTIIYKNNISGK